MQLLERDSLLSSLEALLDGARAGTGVFAFVGGEAGIGKTALMTRFTQTLSGRTRVLWGYCDRMSTPAPLGPLQDIARQLAEVGCALSPLDSPRVPLFAECLEVFRSAATVVVFEDVHWADEATLDLLRYIGRRVARTRALVVATYRDDELGTSHPLRVLLGDLANVGAHRLSIPPLSSAAVRALAGERDVDAKTLHAITGGNAFFVTEVLGAVSGEIPPTVRDAVLARISRLSRSALAVLDSAAIAGSRVEPWLLAQLASAEFDAIAQCEEAGVIRHQGGRYAFRHELARQTILESMPPARRRAMHAAALRALSATPETRDDCARLAHHATCAEDNAAVLRLAPQAARQAASRGAHRESAAHLRRALAQAGRLAAAQQAALLQAHAYECYLISDIEEAVRSRKAVLELARACQDRLMEGENLRWLSRLRWFGGFGADAERYAAAAVDVLAKLPPGHELAMAFSNLSQLKMLAEDVDAAVAWGQKAIALAESLGATDVLAHALNNVGTSLVLHGDASGFARLERSLLLSREGDLQEHAARAYCNLVSQCVTRRDYRRAQPYLADGIAYCNERDLDSWSRYLMAWRTRFHFDQGRWDEAAGEAIWLCEQVVASPVARMPALAVLGHVRVRRGDPGAMAALNEGRELADRSGELQRIWPITVARAEAAWFDGTLQRCVPELRSCLELARSRGNPWALGETALWLQRADSLSDVPVGCAEPFALQLRGQWRAAAALWQSLSCPYEQAWALAEGDVTAQSEAVALLGQLGALPAVKRLRELMRARGLPSIPRGPRTTTRANPFGLTSREVDILSHVASGLSNVQIAALLHRSVRTVDHHVAAILSKLGVASRQEAVDRSERHGLTARK